MSLEQIEGTEPLHENWGQEQHDEIVEVIKKSPFFPFILLLISV